MGVMRYHCSRGWRFPRRDQPPFRKQAQIKSEANARAPLVGHRTAWGLAHGDGAINGRYQGGSSLKAGGRYSQPAATTVKGRRCGGARLFDTLSITLLPRPTMPPTKRQRLEENSDADSDSDGVVKQSSDAGEEGLEEVYSDADQMSSEDDSPDTEDEIAAAKASKSKKTLKRKRRATDPSSFGVTLNALLSTNAPSSLPLSLKPSAARKRNEEKQELKAKKAQRTEKKEREDKSHVSDVIGGWGGESERALRKVAQRGGRSRKFSLPISHIDDLAQW